MPFFITQSVVTRKRRFHDDEQDGEMRGLLDLPAGRFSWFRILPSLSRPPGENALLLLLYFNHANGLCESYLLAGTSFQIQTNEKYGV